MNGYAWVAELDLTMFTLLDIMAFSITLQEIESLPETPYDE